MCGIVTVGCCAHTFYFLGELEYRRGGALLAVSFLAPSVLPTPVPFVAIVMSSAFAGLCAWRGWPAGTQMQSAF